VYNSGRHTTRRTLMHWKGCRRGLPGLEDMVYGGRLNKLGLFSLDHRRMSEEVIEVYMVMISLDRLDSQSLFSRVQGSITQGYMFKVRGGKFKRDVPEVCLV